jgi:hypothetical protein
MSSIKFNQQQHLAKAQDNTAFSADLDQLEQPHRAWQVIGLFYASVHLLQAYFVAKTKYYPQTHQERDDLILKDGNLTKIQRAYFELKQLSVSCRYMCWPTNLHDVTQAQKHLAAIRQHIDSLLM